MKTSPMITVAVLTALALPLAAFPLATSAQDKATTPGQAARPAPAATTAPAAADAGGGAGGTAPGKINDFPTQARVEYVLGCMDDNAERPKQEMFYKCVCAADAVAARVSHDRWVELSVFNSARPIAGERGAYVRERRDAPAMMRAYRELQANAYKSCFINKVPGN